MGKAKTAEGAEAGRPVSGVVARGPGAWIARMRLGGRLLANVAYDARRFWRHAGMRAQASRNNLTARMLSDAHFLEYGMALRTAQPGFGRARAHRLAQDLDRCLAAFGPIGEAQIGLQALQAYLSFNIQAPEGLDPIVAAVERGQPRCDTALRAGVETVTRDQIRAASAIDFPGFVRARHSIRSFIPGPQPVEQVRRAARVAQETPSSCNRQTCRVHAWTDPDLVNSVRKFQRGNRTFGHELSAILVVTSDLGAWDSVGERTQGFVDGGLFLMTLTYALHAEGLGTCILNWSVEKEQDQTFREFVGLDDGQLVIALIGVGWMPESFAVCVSQRVPLDQILLLNPPLGGAQAKGQERD